MCYQHQIDKMIGTKMIQYRCKRTLNCQVKTICFAKTARNQTLSTRTTPGIKNNIPVAVSNTTNNQHVAATSYKSRYYAKTFSTNSSNNNKSGGSGNSSSVIIKQMAMFGVCAAGAYGLTKVISTFISEEDEEDIDLVDQPCEQS